jgi:hypothetical protein
MEDGLMSKPLREEALSASQPPPTPIDWRSIVVGGVISAAAGALVKWALKHPNMQGKGSPRDGKVV